MTATVFLILLVCLLMMRAFFTCLIVLLIGIFVLSGQPAHAKEILAAPASSPYEGSIDHKQDANWRKTLDKAARLSTMQNHGHADVEHTCYAEDKKAFCATVITYRGQGNALTFVRVIRRGEDNSVFARDVCQFNKAETLRTCINFDNGYKSYWAENKDGDFEQVDREKTDDEAASGGL
jgi:hypothetical protein